MNSSHQPPAKMFFLYSICFAVLVANVHAVFNLTLAVSLLPTCAVWISHPHFGTYSDVFQGIMFCDDTGSRKLQP